MSDLAPPDDLDEQAMMEMFRAKKKKKKVSADTPAPEGGPAPNHDQPDTSDETYEELLSRLFAQMGQTDQAEQGSMKKLRRPQTAMIGSKRTGWVNFAVTADTLSRTYDHLSSFVEAELGTQVSQDSKGCLVVKGRFSSEQFQGLLRKYVMEYVKCKTCLGMDTSIQKDTGSRLSFLKCSLCLSQWTVAGIQKGFHAVTKADRKNARA